MRREQRPAGAPLLYIPYDDLRRPAARDQRRRQEPDQDAGTEGGLRGGCLAEAFDYIPTVVVRSRTQMGAVVDKAPQGFGTQAAKYLYDAVFLKEPLSAKTAMKSLSMKPGVDEAHAGTGVLYLSRLKAKATSSRLNRIASFPIYSSMTIRNWNTTTKLLSLMDEGSRRS
jgi:uncharacterized protein (DUF1697 family)